MLRHLAGGPDFCAEETDSRRRFALIALAALGDLPLIEAAAREPWDTAQWWKSRAFRPS